VPVVLTVVGDLVEDVVVWTAGLAVGTDNPATVHRCRGGSAANVAAFAAARTPTRFIGRVGDDESGRRLTAELAAAGVDVRAQRGGTTGTIVVLVTPDGERTMFADRGASAALVHVDTSWLEGTAVLHLPAYGLAGPHMRQALVDAAAFVRSTGGVVAVDVSAVSLVEALGPVGLRHLLEHIEPTIVFANRPEADALDLLARPVGSAWCVVKDGAAATTITAAGRAPVSVAVAPVAIVRDTTGAGDAFAAGFLVEWIDRQDVRAAAAAGHGLAASVLGRPGAGPTRERSCTTVS
jgi:sugar/nucleoside kinase (ribokinase family)